MKPIEFDFKTDNLATAVGIDEAGFTRFADRLSAASTGFLVDSSNPGVIAKWAHENLSPEELLLCTTKLIMKTINDAGDMAGFGHKKVDSISAILDILSGKKVKKDKKVKKSKKEKKESKEPKASDLKSFLETLSSNGKTINVPGGTLKVVKAGRGMSGLADILSQIVQTDKNAQASGAPTFEDLLKKAQSTENKEPAVKEDLGSTDKTVDPTQN